MQNKMLEQTLGIKSVLQTGLTLNSDQNFLEVQTSPMFGNFPRQQVPVFDHFCGEKIFLATSWNLPCCNARPQPSVLSQCSRRICLCHFLNHLLGS